VVSLDRRARLMALSNVRHVESYRVWERWTEIVE